MAISVGPSKGGGGKGAGKGGGKSGGAPVGPGRGSRGGGAPRGGHGGAPRAGKGGGPYSGALYNPSQTLSGASLANAAQGIANAQTQGPISELAKQIATNQQSNQNGQATDFGYYMQLAQAAKDAVAQQGQIGAGLNSTLQGIGSQTQQQLGQIGAQYQQGALGRMAGMGLDGGGQADVAGALAQQQGVAAQNANTFRSAGALQGANYQGNAANERGVVSLAGTQQIGDLARAGTLQNEPLNAKIAALQEKNGALDATALGQLRTQERNYQIAQEGIGVKSAQVRATAANDQARNQIASQRNSITAQNDAANQSLKRIGLANTKSQNATLDRLRLLSIQNTAQNDAANRALKADIAASKVSGGTKPLTPNENNLANTKIGEVISAIQTWQQQGIKNSKGQVIEPHPTDAQMREVLGSRYDPNLVEAGFELLGWGVLRPATASALHSMGIRGTTFRGQPVRVQAGPKSAPVSHPTGHHR